MRYAAYTTEDGVSYIDQVNEFLGNTESGTFTATMILVAQWLDVCPFGDNQCSEVLGYNTCSFICYIFLIIG